MSRRVIGLDLGAYSVKLVRLQCGKQTPKFEIINVHEEVLASSENEEQPSLQDLQKQALEKLQKLGLLEAEMVASGLMASFGQMRTMQVPFLDNRKLEAVLPGLLEEEIPFDIDEMIVSWHRVNEPLTADTEKPEFASINVAFGKKIAILEMLQSLQTFSVNPRLLHLSSAAPFELVRELKPDTFIRPLTKEEGSGLGAIIDFGHQATNLCIFDPIELKYARSFLRGGKKLSEEIASSLNVSFAEAQRLKHEEIDLSRQSFEREDLKIINDLAAKHYYGLIDDIWRTMIALKTNGLGTVKTVTFIGGGALTKGLTELFSKQLCNDDITINHIADTGQQAGITESTALAFGYALSCIQVHAKTGRFSFRKDEFTWRGDLDFLRTKSTALILWSLALVCSLTVMWSASSLVLQKENRHVESLLKTVCAEILGQKNIAPKKCLAQMKEQIASNVSVGIPEFSSSDVYVKLAASLPKELNLIIREMDISDKKVRIIAKTGSFEDVDKVFALVAKIPCFVNVEKGRAQQLDGAVEFHLTSDVDCDLARAKSKSKT